MFLFGILKKLILSYFFFHKLVFSYFFLSFFLLFYQGFIDSNDEAFLSTLKYLEQKLRRGKFLAVSEKDEMAHNSATFSYIKVLVSVGRKDEARELFENMLRMLNHVGIFSESIEPKTQELWGNLPQSTAMVGLIDCALVLSKPWKGAF